VSNKIFMGVVAAVLLAALGAGGAFAGGVAYERGQEEPVSSATVSELPSPSGTQAQFAGAATAPEGFTNLRALIQSGDATPEELERLREQFAGQAGAFGQGGGGFGGGGGGVGGRLGGGGARFGGGGLNGTIESIEGNTITLNTAQGPLQVTISQETTINDIVEVDLSALTQEIRVSVTGQRNDAGVMEADSITITPEGFGFGGGGGGFQRGFGGQTAQIGQ
jgi:hypothetical protein